MMKTNIGDPVRKTDSCPCFFGPDCNAFIGPLASLALEERIANDEQMEYTCIDYCKMQVAENH